MTRWSAVPVAVGRTEHAETSSLACYVVPPTSLLGCHGRIAHWSVTSGKVRGHEVVPGEVGA
jgi:hypothetical protein